MGLLRRAGLSDKGTTIILLILLLLLAALLRFYGLDAKSLWQDEVATLRHSSAGGVVGVLSTGLKKALPTPALCFLITRFFLCAGDSDFTLRFPALLFGVLGVALTYALGARLFGKREGLAGAFLLAISPL